MCGLAGYIGFEADEGMAILKNMADAQIHRGPDGAGHVTEGMIGLAHRRLAVIDRHGGRQPMRSADGRYVMVYNGEVYNFRELAAELAAVGHEFATKSDTEVVLAAWAQWGAAAFDRFNGMFAIAIADTRTGECVLARDQFGIKPLHLAEVGGGRVVFASEIRPILASGLVEPAPDDATIHRYLRFRVHDDTDRTFFAGIRRLPPGHMAVLSPGGRITRSVYTTLYDDLRGLAGERRPYDRAARAEFAGALRSAVRARLVSDVPVGTALSGGLDSSTVAATINALIAESDAETAAVGERQQTFSAVFPGERNDEERFVDAVAGDYAGTLHARKVRPSVAGFMADLRDFIRTQEEPVISTGPYAQYCVMREAGRHVTVMLDGQGADEMLAGYLPHLLVHVRELLRRGERIAAAAELWRARDMLWQLARFRLADRVRGRARPPVTALLSPAFLAAHAGERFTVCGDDLKRRLEQDLFRTSLPALLRAEDRNTMRFSVEGRVPFLDAGLLRLLWRLDSTAILHHGWNKRALRDAADPLLPRAVSRRRGKIGFTTPEDRWFALIGEQIREVFASESFAARPYFHQEAVLTAFQAFLDGRAGGDTMTFWRLLNVELWLREFVDPAARGAGPATRSAAAGDGARAARVPEARSDRGEDPGKSDYAANPGKPVVLPRTRWARFPLVVSPPVRRGDDVPAIAARRVARFFDDAPARVRETVAGRPWYLFVSEKVVAISQGRSYFLWDIAAGPWARCLSRFVTRSPHGIGLGHPATMQLAIREIGLPRILLAAAAGIAGKAVGRRGLFYDVAGPAVRAIDGPTQYSVYPANVSAKLAPADPDGVARRITAAVRDALPADVARYHRGTVIIDSNDLGRDVLGHDTMASTAELAAAFADNPIGQGRQCTPLAVVVLLPRAAGRRAAGPLAGARSTS